MQRKAGTVARAVVAPVLCAATLSLMASIGTLTPSSARAMDMPPGMKMPASGVTLTRAVGAYRLELHVLPPEPFYTAEEVSAKHLTAGMLVTGGASPVSPAASPAPNHHLVVHVVDRKSGQSVADASVTLRVQSLDAAGKPTGMAMTVPVVVMQAIGAGPSSTHYGNNVVLDAGSYRVTVTVNGTAASFQVRI